MSCFPTTARSRWPRRSTILAGLFPGRIDLGLGRAAGTDPMTTFALQRAIRRAGRPRRTSHSSSPSCSRTSTTSLPEDHPFARLARHGCPDRPELPGPVASLGSSPQSAIPAGAARAPGRVRGLHQLRGRLDSRRGLYRERYRRHPRTPRFRGRRSPPVVCALPPTTKLSTCRRAARLAVFTMLRRNQADRGSASGQGSPVFFEREGKSPSGDMAGWRSILGSPEKVRAGVEEVAVEYARRR